MDWVRRHLVKIQVQKRDVGHPSYPGGPLALPVFGHALAASAGALTVFSFSIEA